MKRIVIGIASALALITLIHLPPFGGWLGITGHGSSGCPFGFDHPQTAKVDARLRGDTPAHARPALGFALDGTTAADVMQWSAAHGLDCTAKYRGAMISCMQVPASALPGATLGLASAWFTFGARGTLSSLKTVRRDPAVAAVSAAFTGVAAVVATAGPMTMRGSASPEVLGRGLLRQASLESRFTDYRAVVRATNMGNGFALSEEYSTLVD